MNEKILFWIPRELSKFEVFIIFNSIFKINLLTDSDNVFNIGSSSDDQEIFIWFSEPEGEHDLFIVSGRIPHYKSIIFCESYDRP